MVKKKAILIINGEELNSDALTAALSDDFSIIAADGEREAFGLLKSRADDIAAVLLDMSLPQTGGFDFLKWLSTSQFCGLPAIVISSDEGRQTEAFENGAWDFIAPPADWSILRVRISNILKRCGLSNSAGGADGQLMKAQAELERANAKARETLDSFSILVNTVPGGIALYEVVGSRIKTVYYSDGMCALSGYTREERDAICGGDAIALTYEEDVYKLTSAIDEAVKNRACINLTYRIRTKSGGPRWVNLRASFSANCPGKYLYYAVFTNVDDIMKMEQRSKELSMRYEVAIKSSGINIWEYDIRTDVLTVVANSPRIKQNCFSIPDYISSTLTNRYVREDSIQTFLDIFKRLKNGEKEVGADIWYKTTDEAGWWCERVSYTTVFGADGTPAKAFGAGRDVTREKEAIRRFNDEVTYRAAIQKYNFDSLKINLTKNTIIDGNSPFRVLSELIERGDADYYFQKTADYIVGEENKTLYRSVFSRSALFARFQSGEYTASMELTRVFDENRVYWIRYNVHLMKDPDSSDIIAFVVATDITGERVMKTIMETIVRTDYDFFIMVDGETNSACDYTVNAGKKLFEPKVSFEERCDELIRSEVAAPDLEMVLSECRIDNIMKHISGGTAYKFDYNNRTENGELRRKQLQFTLIDGARKSFLMTRIDVNGVYEEQKKNQLKLEYALAEAEKASKIKTEFLAKMSHDIRTPMNAVIGMTELAMYEENPPKTREYLENIESSSRFLLGLINDILDFSKMENSRIELHPQRFDLGEFRRNIDTVIRPLTNAKHIKLDFILKCGINAIIVDKMRFCQIFFNLLSNSAKFTHDGGTITFESERLPDKNGKLGLRYYVRDDGIGMSRSFLAHLFEPFTQERIGAPSDQPGTGLGLAIVKNLVDMMDGDIKVKSELGRGTEFTVDLYVGRADADTQAEESAAQVSLAGRRVLLVEDNKLNIIVAQRLLERRGAEVTIAENGREAADKFIASEVGHFDAILMDVRMPVMDGLEAAEYIRSLKRADAKNVPIIAMTADAFAEDQDKTQNAGMNAHLTKPIEPQKLYAALTQCIALKGDEPQNTADKGDTEH